MTKIKSTKRALIVSALALVVCVSMLVGSTFAWFTDSVTSTGNKIVSGNLDVDLYMWNSDTDSTEITDASAPIFGSAALAQNDEQTLWEPGKTQVAYLSIKNNGSLDLKYKVAVNVKNAKNDLFEVMEYAITPDAKFGTVDAWDAANGKKVELGVNATDAVDVALKAGEEHFFALSVHMQETAGNKYMNGEVDFDIQVLAGQLASEFDSFDNTYDTLASYAGTGFAAVVAGEAIEVQIKGTDDYKVGSAIIPANAIAAGTSSVAVTVVDTVYNGNFTVSANETAKSYDVTVTGLKENNTEPVKVQIRIPADLDPNTVKLYHYDTELTCTYNPNTGYVTFETATFSPFTIVYEAGSSYVPPVADEKALPTATVTELSSDKYQNIDWGNYDQWSPTAGLEANLETAYEFVCDQDLEEAKSNPFANWYCDFYLKLDKDLGENQIFLGGNYGSFGWIGFHNGDVTLKANEEIALLGSVTSNPWTYLDVVQNVGTFTCGVGDVNDALKGAKFTVMLRLTNPENEAEYYNVETIEYTFN